MPFSFNEVVVPKIRFYFKVWVVQKTNTHPWPTDIPLSLLSIQPSSQPGSIVQDHEKEKQNPTQAPKTGVEGDSQENVSEEPDLSTLSLTKKMAIFNRLSHTTDKPAEGARRDTRLRRANTRFQTQPITQGEMQQVRNDFMLQVSHENGGKMLKIKKYVRITFFATGWLSDRMN